jgi:hypothetical protein
MTPRSLFKIILKIFGLFFLKEIVNSLPQLISNTIIYLEAGRVGETVFTIAINAIVILFYGLIIFQLLFNTNTILDKFKLDQGLDEEELSFEAETKKSQFSIGVSPSFILVVALLVTAGVILVNEIPYLFKQLFVYIITSRSLENNDVPFIVISIVKILIALLLIGERKFIIQLVISDKSKNKEIDNEE